MPLFKSRNTKSTGSHEFKTKFKTIQDATEAQNHLLAELTTANSQIERIENEIKAATTERGVIAGSRGSSRLNPSFGLGAPQKTEKMIKGLQTALKEKQDHRSEVERSLTEVTDFIEEKKKYAKGLVQGESGPHELLVTEAIEAIRSPLIPLNEDIVLYKHGQMEEAKEAVAKLENLKNTWERHISLTPLLAFLEENKTALGNLAQVYDDPLTKFLLSATFKNAVANFTEQLNRFEMELWTKFKDLVYYQEIVARKELGTKYGVEINAVRAYDYAGDLTLGNIWDPHTGEKVVTLPGLIIDFLHELEVYKRDPSFVYTDMDNSIEKVMYELNKGIGERLNAMAKYQSMMNSEGISSPGLGISIEELQWEFERLNPFKDDPNPSRRPSSSSSIS